MAEYIQSVASETVGLNTPITFDSSIPCNRGNVVHEDGTGVFILRGIVNNASSCFARYQITFNGNIAIPAGGALTAIAVALSVNGEPRTFSKAVYTPAAVEDFGNVTSTAVITVPKGCCFTVSVDYVDATVADAATTPTPSILVENGNVTITRIA